MTELARFQQFFRDHGVKQEYTDIGTAPKPKEAAEATCYVTVGQTHFYFDKDGVFIGYQLDEMGLWFSRESGPFPITSLTKA